MSGAVKIIDTSTIGSRYAAALLCLRLLRAVLANIAFAIGLFTCFGVLILILLLGAVTGWLALNQPWSTAVRGASIGVVLVAGALLLLALMAAILIRSYFAASRGSAVVAKLVLSMAILTLALSGADLAVHGSSFLSAPNEERGTELLNAARNVWPIYVAVGFIYGAWGLLQLARSDSKELLFVAHYNSGNRRQALLRMMGTPRVLSLPRGRLRRSLLLGWVAFACEGFAFSTYFTSSVNETPTMPLPLASAIVLIGWPVSAAILYGLLALAQWLWSQARRAGQPSLQEVLATDRRPPVLFLRSFADDRVSLAAARVPSYLRVMDPGISRRRFEELLVFAFDQVGPLIAIGNPTDPSPPIGASRQYLGPGQWQDQVLWHMAHAQTIVVSLSNTEALSWELAQIRQRGYLHKVLFIVPPLLSDQFPSVQAIGRRAGLQLVTQDFSEHGHGADDAEQKRILACWSRDANCETIITSSRLSELDYDIALRLYVSRFNMLVTAGS